MLQRNSKPSRTYGGHSRLSWITHDIDELTELRARQRTFDGAYIRAALVALSYALVILKIFSKDFATIGLLFTILAFLMLVTSLVRRSGDKADFCDTNVPSSLSRSESGRELLDEQQRLTPASKRLWGRRKFRTAGWVVVLMTSAVVGIQLAIAVLVLRLDTLVR